MNLSDEEQTAVADLIGYAANPGTWPSPPDAEVIAGLAVRLGFEEDGGTIVDLRRKIEGGHE